MALDKTKALTDLESAKLYMGETTTANDRLIDRLIMDASVLIARELDTGIVEQTYTNEVHSGNGGYYLYLNNWPVTEVIRCAVDDISPVTVKLSGTTAARATVAVIENAIVLRKVVSGVTTRNELVFSDYVTLAAMETAAEALGYTVDITSSYTTYPSADLLLQGARSIRDKTAYLRIPSESETDYEIDIGNQGLLYNPYGWTVGNANIFITYQAGYSVIPEPLESACLELVKTMKDLAERDQSVKSEKIGDYAYTTADRVGTVFSATGNQKTASMVMTKLEAYRRPLIYG